MPITETHQQIAQKNRMKFYVNSGALCAFCSLAVIEMVEGARNEGVIKHLEKLRSSHIMTVDEIKSAFPCCVEFVTRYGPWPPVHKEGLLLKCFRTACIAAALLRDSASRLRSALGE